MSKPLRIILLEDNAADADLVRAALNAAPLSYVLQHARDAAAFTALVNESQVDLILSDYSIPGFSGLAALQLVRKKYSDVPFISISGTIGEASAVELIRQGATDHIEKDRLDKLFPAIQRALLEAEQRLQVRRAEASLRDSEARFRAVFEGAGTGIAVEDLEGRIMETNRALQQMLGYSAEELLEITRRDFTHGKDHEEDQAHYQRLLSGRSDFYQVEKRFVRRDGRIIWGRLTVSMARDKEGKPQFPLVMIEDITERQRSEETYMQFGSIVEFSNDAIISSTFDGIIFSWNPAAERVYGFSETEANGRSLSLIIPPDKEDESTEMLERIRRGERVDNFETTRMRKDGTLIHVSVTTSSIKDIAGKIIGASFISRDITERKRAEAALRESEENYRKLVELSPDGILIQANDKYVYLNSAAVEMLGAQSAPELLGRPVLDLVHPDFREIVEENIRQLQAGKDVALHEEKLIRVDGSFIDVEAVAIPFQYCGQPAFQVVIRNITERKRAEQALRRSEAGLARAQRIAHLGNWEYDLAAGTLTWSEETYRIFGLDRSQGEITNSRFYELVHPGDVNMVRRASQECLLGGKPYRVDHRIILPTGEIKTVTEQAEILLDEAGRPIRMSGTVLDITERKRAEDLSASFAQLGQRLNSATSSVEAAKIIADEADRLFGWDACNLLLCSPDASEFHTIYNVDLIEGKRTHGAPGRTESVPSPMMQRVFEQGAQLILREAPVKFSPESHPFGDKARPSASILYVPVRNGPKVVGMFSIHSYSPNAYTQTDLETLQALGDHCGGALERIRAEVENQKLAAFPQVNPNPVLELNRDGAINYYNEAARQMALSLGKKEPAEFLPPETDSIVHECLATGQSKLRIQTVIQNRTISWSFFPVVAIGVVHCYAGDITERQQLEAHLRQAQKMESIGQLAGGIAHDFNNILTVIQGHSTLLGMSEKLGDEARESMQQIAMAAERAANLTRQLLTFSRRQIIQPKNLDLNEVVNNMTKMLRRLLGEDITLQVSYTPGLPLIHADPGMMEQILLNLAVNARDAMPRGGSLFVHTTLAVIDKIDAAQIPNAVAGNYVCLTVKDTGCGISPDVLPHIFEPFFTTKDVGKGTGLGLATVYGVVQQHHGWIKATSTLNRETVFQIFLPAISEKSSGALHADTVFEAKVRGGKETILIVEDEPPLRMLVRSVLQRYGYKVYEAISGMGALGVWEEHKDEIQLLLTDMVMPHGIGGRELAKKLIAEKPELKVIYTSGYSLAVVGTDMVLQEGLNFLQKPYHPRKLAQAVRDCLDG